VDGEAFRFRLFNDTKIKSHLPQQQYALDDNDDEEHLAWAKFSLQDLKTHFKPHKVMNTMSCAGNRRKGMKEFDKSV
jgi:hypothetical protein